MRLKHRYWLNGECRHPLSALLMAGPGIGLVVALGAARIPAALLFTWLRMPRGNTGGAKIGAFETRPIPPALQFHMGDTSQ